MEDQEVVYCEVIGPGKDAQPKPRQSQKNEASILELVAANLVRPRRIPAPRTHTVFNQPLHKMRSKLLIEITSGHENSSRYLQLGKNQKLFILICSSLNIATVSIS